MNNAKPKKPTKEEQAAQVARFLSQKRESYFQLILSNLIHNAHYNAAALTEELKHTVDSSLEAADYALQKLFPIVRDEKTEG